ncbi:hypothetical protein [Streptomyces sp. SLBN-118]|uniref:hypothetical protein n=1 Tax=Streptomyces sp. SLBN-118 TaxID=2768454 RepID=UPI0021B3A3CF|nr:hypothetical protein [Streptomyces sp. SLBN-118]
MGPITHLRADSLLGAACGMGIKMFGVPGASLPADEAEATAFDLDLISNKVFFANTAYDHMVIEELFAELPDALVNPARRTCEWGERLPLRRPHREGANRAALAGHVSAGRCGGGRRGVPQHPRGRGF